VFGWVFAGCLFGVVVGCCGLFFVSGGEHSEEMELMVVSDGEKGLANKIQ
jgi:hypothetical protein